MNFLNVNSLCHSLEYIQEQIYLSPSFIDKLFTNIQNKCMPDSLSFRILYLKTEHHKANFSFAGKIEGRTHKIELLIQQYL